MKERHWTNLIGALRHGQCVLVLGTEIPARVVSKDGQAGDENKRLSEELAAELTREMEEDNPPRKVFGYTLAAIAQQYEDAYDSNSLQATAERFFRSGKYARRFMRNWRRFPSR